MRSSSTILTVGLLTYEPGWELLLNQIGVSWKVVSKNPGELSASAYSVIIVNTHINDNTMSALSDFLKSGGSLLSIYGCAQTLVSLTPRKKFVRTLSPVREDYCSTSGVSDIDDHGMFFDEHSSVSLHRVLHGTLINIPFDVNRLLLRISRKRKNFYSFTSRFPNEIVSGVSKKQIREIVTSSLEFLHHQRGLPFIHAWFFPENQRTIFTFRIDSDKGSRDEIEGLYQLSENYNIPTTWFLDVKSHESWINYFLKFKRQEIGLHCYTHETYDTVSENLHNFTTALSLLSQHGIECSGAAAPRGAWNRSIAMAFEELKLSYSSEFSADYDNVPSYPWTGERFSPVVQIPVHPVCSGTMRRARFTSDDQIHYFKSIVDRCIDLCEPICFYHHPTHHYNEVFQSIFTYINELSIPKLSYREYAEWWKKRSTVKTEFRYDSATHSLYASVMSEQPDVWHRLSLPGRKEVLHHIGRHTDLHSLEFGTLRKNVSLPPDVMRIRKFDWRHYLINALERLSTLSS